MFSISRGHLERTRDFVMFSNYQLTINFFERIIFIINIVVRATTYLLDSFLGSYSLFDYALALRGHGIYLSMKSGNFVKCVKAEQFFFKKPRAELFKINRMYFKVQNLMEVFKQSVFIKDFIQHFFFSKLSLYEVERCGKSSHLNRRSKAFSLKPMNFFVEEIKSACFMKKEVGIIYLGKIYFAQKRVPLMVPDLGFSTLNPCNLGLRKPKNLSHFFLRKV